MPNARRAVVTGLIAIAMLVFGGGAPAGAADAAPVIVPGSASVAEGDAGSTIVDIPVTLSRPTTVAVTVQWTTIFGPGVRPPAPADPATDFTAAHGTATFAPGTTSTTVAVTVHGDRDREPDEWIVVSFTNPANATVGGYWGLGFAVITDDDTPPTVIPGSVSVAEGDAGATTVDIPVTLSRPWRDPVTVEWTTIFGPGVRPPAPADPATDFTAAHGTATFAPGTTSTSVAVTVHGDRDREPDEWIVVSFTNPTNATVGGYWGLGFAVITDDDTPVLFDDTVHQAAPIGSSLAAGDFDGDGSTDLAMASLALQGVAILRNDGQGGFALVDPVIPAGRNPMDVATADLDGDGLTDVVAAGGEGVRVLLSDGDGTFTATPARDVGQVWGASIADFDGNGTPDVAVGTFYGTYAIVLPNDGHGVLGAGITVPTGSLLSDTTAADIDRDGDQDLLVADSSGSTGTVGVLRNRGDGTFAARVPYDPGVEFGNVTNHVAAADLDGDGATDLVATTSTQTVSVLRNEGGGTFATATTFPTGAWPVAVAVVDLDGDGVPDVVTANRDSDDLSVLLGDGRGGFVSRSYAAGRKPSDLVVADLDGNRLLDVAASSYTDGDLAVLLHRT